MSKFANFYDESRALRSIAQRDDLAILQTASDLISQSKEHNKADDIECQPNIPKLHGLARILPIASESSATSI